MSEIQLREAWFFPPSMVPIHAEQECVREGLLDLTTESIEFAKSSDIRKAMQL